MVSRKEQGQAMILAAAMVGIMVSFVVYLLINAGGWYRDTTQITQAMHRAARDGASALTFGRTLDLDAVPAHTLPSNPEINRQCLDITAAKTATRTALTRDLAQYESHFDGVTAADIARDTSGTYLTLAVGNPVGLGCLDTGDVHPAGDVYTHPWVYVSLTVPIRSLAGHFTINWHTETTVTSAVDTQGG